MSNDESSPEPRWNPDQVILWIVSVLVVGVGVNIVTSSVQGSPLAWIAAVLLAVTAVATSPRGFLRRSRYGGIYAAFVGAWLAIGGYVAVAVYISKSEGNLDLQLAQMACLWAAVALLTGQTMSAHLGFTKAAAGLGLLLAGVAMLLIGLELLLGVAFLDVASLSLPVGWLCLLCGLVLLWLGVGVLLGTSTPWLVVPSLGVAVFGAPLLAWLATFSDTSFSLWGVVAFLLLGVAALLLVVGLLLDAPARLLPGLALVLVGVAAALVGVGSLFDGSFSLWGVVAFLMFGFAGLWLGVSALRSALTQRSHGAPFLLCGCGLLLFGVEFLVDDSFWLLLGVAAVSSGVAMLLIGAGSLFDGSAASRSASLRVKTIQYLMRRRDEA